MNKTNIFVSSTCYDLAQIRADIYEFITSAGHNPILSDYPSFPIDPTKQTIENCIQNIKNSSDIFVLIIGNRYGNKIDIGKSITNIEYLYAKEKKIPIYVFILKQMLNSLLIWEKNKNGDFSNIVDSTEIFDFIKAVRDTDNIWCFEFEKAQDIIETLKIQLSFLLYDSLQLSLKLKKNQLPYYWDELSSNAINLLIEKDDHFEIRFFSQCLRDELKKYENLRKDLDHKILMKSEKIIDELNELINWIGVHLGTLNNFIITSEHLMQEAFKKYFGELGIPSDINGLFYVAKTLARIYKEMIEWSIQIQSTAVEEEFLGIRDSFAKYTISSIENIQAYPDKIDSDLQIGLNRLEKGEENVKVSCILEFDIDDDATNRFQAEMDKLRISIGLDY